jgi:DNA-binding CsgD family transcriptional regulator
MRPGIETPRTTLQRLRARDTAVLNLLLAGRPLAQISESLHLNRATVWRIRRKPEFESAFQAARHELLAGLVDRLRNDASDFADVLHKTAMDEKARGSDRVLASRHGLDLLLRGVETLDLAERIARLEQVAGQRGQG